MAAMENNEWHNEPEGLGAVLADIAALVLDNPQATMREVNEVLGRHNRATGEAQRRFAKKHLLPGFLRLEKENPSQLAEWGLGDDDRTRLFQLLRMKPRRTASGVATITVLTKPWPCSSNCDYCPNDIRMPKSYLSDEPACQRAERNFFDPYLQVHARLHTLNQMGHPTDKVELIVLGGTWSDYPLSYQLWFMEQLFCALNDGDGEAAQEKAEQRRSHYRNIGLADDRDELFRCCEPLQKLVCAGDITYNQAVRRLYGLENPSDGASSPAMNEATPKGGSQQAILSGNGRPCTLEQDSEQASRLAEDTRSKGAAPTIEETAQRWRAVSEAQTASWERLFAAQAINETASSRCVGLVIETRPALVTATSLTQLRAFGCTKVQMGIQTLDPTVAAANHRVQDNREIARAFALLRRFGFKIHVHFMANLQGATPEGDRADFRTLVEDPRFMPDEVKLYPCVLVGGTALEACYRRKAWQPYPEDQLVQLLADNLLASPAYVRVSRMIRDISATDIMAGSKKTNLRQMVEQAVRAGGHSAEVREIRFREIAGQTPNPESLSLEIVSYCPMGSSEYFLQWTTPEGKIAGFLRLSLPKPTGELPNFDDGRSAMIREVHIYGVAAPIHQEGHGAQHTGLGRKLISRACKIATENGYERINVISAVGTREYYRSLGFADNGLYQTKELAEKCERV